jgi:hypothetical protein
MGVVGLEMCTRYRFLIIITQEATIEKRPPFISPQFLVSSYINIKHKVERRCAVVGCSFLMDFCFYFIFFSSFDWESKISPFSFLYYYNSRWNLCCSAPQRWEWRMNNNNNNKDRIYFLFFPFFDVYSREGKKLFFRQHKSPLYTQ